MTDTSSPNAEEKRLVRTILARKGQADFFVMESAPAQQQALLSQAGGLFAQNGITPAYIDLSQGVTLGQVMEKLADYAREGVDVVHLTGGGEWLRGREPFNEGTAVRTDLLNIRRENLFRLKVKTMLWLAADDIGMLATTAPDLWAWRSGVYDLSTPAPAATAAQKPPAAPAGPV